MYTISKISCLTETIGIIGGVGTDYSDVIADALNPATALVVVNDIHPLITPENISSCLRDATTMGINEWSNSTAYLKNQKVSLSGKYYKALRNNTNKSPLTEAADWVEVSLINEQLIRLINASANKMLKSVFDKKQINQTVKSILDDFYLFDGRADNINLNANLNRLVGFRISLKDPRDINIIIHKIAAQFVGSADTIPIKLYHSSVINEPVLEVDLAFTNNGNVEWFDIADMKLNYVADNTDSGGVWYLVYNEADIPGLQSTKKEERNFVYGPACGSCLQTYQNMYAKRSKYMVVQPFYVNEGNFTAGQLWDESKEMYVEDNNFGLNLSMSAECDLSDFICRNKHQFANALAYQVACDLLQEFTHSMRNNRLEEKVKHDAYFALHGDKNTNNYGLKAELEKAIKAVSFNISGINEICLPCENKKRFHYKAI